MAGYEQETEAVLQLARQLVPEQLPHFLGQLEEARVIALTRLTSPKPAQPQADELLDVAEAAHRLGISTNYLYRHHGEFAFTRRQGKRLLFSANGIEQYIRRESRLTPKRHLATVTPMP
jgi:hypothetical protein